MNRRTVLNIIFLVVFSSVFQSVLSQQVIKGKVSDKKGNPVLYANILITGTFDGTISDESGNFRLETSQLGEQKLQITYIGFDTLIYSVNLEKGKEISLNLIMTEIIMKTNEVVITVGRIEASHDEKVAVLDPIDIVTTAGGQGDIIGAIQALPGVQRNGGDNTGLMVRGGDVNESIVVIDGAVVQNAFFSDVPNVSQRSRFDPFQFKGTAFSSGGYSVRYGQALSAVLELETNDLPDESSLSAGMHIGGIYLSGAKLMDNNGLEFSTSYINMRPYYEISKSNFDYPKPPEGTGFSTRWISKIDDYKIFKTSVQYSSYSMGMEIPDPENMESNINYNLKNENLFSNTSYSHWVNNNIKLFGVLAFSTNEDVIDIGDDPVLNHDNRLQGRGEVYFKTGKRSNLLFGIETQKFEYMQQFDDYVDRFDEALVAEYIEYEFKPIPWFGVNAGLRSEYSKLIDKANLSPRASLAVKTGKNSQVSMAAGLFYQSSPANYLLQAYKPGYQNAIHYLVNYQKVKNNRTLRLEGYYKSYDQLIRENNVTYTPNKYRYYYGVVDNSGEGYARGIDLFWRDRQSLNNLDYWVSYSFIDTERLYQNYISSTTPDYISPHNLNLIFKYFIDAWQLNISCSYNYATGRVYYNPDSEDFLSDRAPDYHNIGLSLSYLTTIKDLFAVVFVSFDNIIAQKNILGYRYSTDGSERYPVIPAMYRSVYFGFNISLTQFSKDEL